MLSRSFKKIDGVPNLLVTVNLEWHDIHGNDYKTNEIHYCVPDENFVLTDFEKELKYTFGAYQPEIDLLIKTHSLPYNVGMFMDKVDCIAFQTVDNGEVN